jgi:hypothetical protein
LTRRYFSSRGPATLEDFVWWSGLLKGEARKGVALCRETLQEETKAGGLHWGPRRSVGWEREAPTAYLLPAYDEYYLGYKARSAVLDGRFDAKAVSSAGVFRPMIVVEGQIVGTWKREMKREEVHITLNPFRTFNAPEEAALLAAAERYGAFLGLAAKIT